MTILATKVKERILAVRQYVGNEWLNQQRPVGEGDHRVIPCLSVRDRQSMRVVGAGPDAGLNDQLIYVKFTKSVFKLNGVSRSHQIVGTIRVPRICRSRKYVFSKFQRTTDRLFSNRA